MAASDEPPTPFKYVRGITDGKRARHTSGSRVKTQNLKAVQVQDLDTEPDSQGDESEAISVRTLRRGDCCLVSSEGDRPHLAVVLRTFLQGKRAMLSVAWLYRQDEVEGEFPLPDCHPREVFVGIEKGDPPFHTDEIDAGSVLHPCKVYFMSAASLARDGPPMAVHGTGQQAHMRPRPGFLCCRAWHIDDKQLLPLPLSENSHKLAAKQTMWLTALTTDRLLAADSKPKRKKRKGSPK